VFLNNGGALFRLVRRYPLFAIAVIVLAIKLSLFVLDPTPHFFMGDSATYVGSAIHGYVPLDRSFTYGLLIRWIALGFHTLQTLIFAQVIAGAVTAWFVGFALLRFFNVRIAIALGGSIVFALDPLQILHERFVLAEAFAMLLFAGQLLLGLYYLEKPGVRTLLANCIVGIGLVSLRPVYAPIVLFEALLLPLIGWLKPSLSTAASKRMKSCALHLIVAIVASVSLHEAYQRIMGRLAGFPPAYQFMDGLFLAASWSPILIPGDAIDAQAAGAIQQQLADLQYPLGDRLKRQAQLWRSGGLVDRLQRAYGGDIAAANSSAKQMSLHALRRDPLGIARLTWSNFKDYLKSPGRLRPELLVEQGSDRPLPSSFVNELISAFGLDASNSATTMTLSKRYHLVGVGWYYFLLVLPVLGSIDPWLCTSTHRSGVFLVFGVSALLLLVTCAASTVSSFRLLHSLSFTGVIALGVFANLVIDHRPNQKGAAPVAS